VTDSRCNAATVRLIEALGAEVHTITEEAPDGSGLLGARLAHVRALCDSDERYLWLNQYENPANPAAHYRTTAPAIARQFPDLDVLFIGAGTCGTLMGCARYMRERRPSVRIVAVDSVGSVIFGGPSGRRLIPGVGAGVRPPQLDESYVDDLVMVPEVDTIRACRSLALRGFLFGGSTGTVVSGALNWLSRNRAGELIAVAIAPDFGERYLGTVYADQWAQEHYGDGLSLDDEPRRDVAHAGRPARSRRLTTARR
jgi:cysteine synthase A